MGYCHSNDHSIHGTGQGSGNSLMIWCFLLSALFDCYDKRSFKATYCCPDRVHTIDIWMMGFVDDSNAQTNCLVSNKTSLTLPRMLQHLRHSAQTWAAIILGASGGALELSKCLCHLVVRTLQILAILFLFTHSNQRMTNHWQLLIASPSGKCIAIFVSLYHT